MVDDTSNEKDKQDFAVGFGKPPKDFQFKKGESGNPNGRPKGSKNIRTLLHQELDSELIIQEGGVSKSITKLEAIIKRLVTESFKGNLKAQEILFRQMDLKAEKVEMDIKNFALDDKVLENYQSRLFDTFEKRTLPEPDDDISHTSTSEQNNSANQNDKGGSNE